MKKILLAIITVIYLFSCDRKSNDIVNILDSAEICIEENPKHSLELLNTINLYDISNNRDRARYALLKTQALDKNYVDVTVDSLTSIAINYYKRRGNADERLKSYYYGGKVFYYAGEYERAMEYYSTAVKDASKCKDAIMVGLLYNAMMMINNMMYNHNDAIQQAELASKAYLSAGDTLRYLNSLNNMAAVMLQAEDLDNVNKYLDEVKLHYSKLSSKQLSNYYTISLRIMDNEDKRSLSDTLNSYLSSVLEKDIDWIIVAYTYCRLEDLENASISLYKYELTTQNPTELFFWINSMISEARGDYKSAYEYRKKCDKAVQEKYYRASQSNVKYIEERYRVQEQNLKQEYFNRILCVVIIFVTAILMLFVRLLQQSKLKHKMELQHAEDERRLQMLDMERIEEEKKWFEEQYNSALIEQGKLQEIISAKSKNSLLTRNLKRVIEDRLSVLNSFIAANITKSYSVQAANAMRELLQDKDEFLKSTGEIFQMSHPKFIAYLLKKHLTAWEIGCCCLYCIGLSGGDISNYLEMKQDYYYKKSGKLRNKLGIDNTTHIDTFLRKKMRDLG